MGELSTRAKEKVSGPAWDVLRPQFDDIQATLLSVDPSTYADLTTIYIKFTLTNDPTSPVYAVMWVKSAKRLVVGLALPEQDLPDELGPAPPRMTYKGLTGYFAVEPDDAVPTALGNWAEHAFTFVSSHMSSNTDEP